MMQADFPDGMGEVHVAAELSLNPLQPKWEIGMVTFRNLKTAEYLAKAVKGYVDTIDGKNVVWSPRQSYLIPMEKNVLGIVRPTDRKLVARWLSKEEKSGSSAYLKKHAMQSTKFLSLMLAVDIEDTWSALAIENRIANFASLKGLDVKANAKLLSTVRGIQIIVGRKNLDECIISLEFANSPSALLPIAKEFFIEVLSLARSSVPEASKWTASVDGNSLAFRGSISVETIDHLLGIFTLQEQASRLPSTETAAKEPASKELESLHDSTSESTLLELNKTYLAKSSNIIKRVREYSAVNTGDRAQWDGQMARRLDDLPTLNVDPELVDFSVRVAQGLRGNMVAMQQSNIQMGAAATVNGAGDSQVGYYYGRYGATHYYNNSDANSTGRYQAVAQAQGNYSYRELMAQIDALEGEIRRKMTEKYKVQF
ncbi:MAG: hypothetical protein NTY15_20385 [Planctomycetota bacterium]|nr:hypothetical protein [Planctomycetota bacterium]